MKTAKAILILAGFLFLLLYPVSSKADTIATYQLTDPNTAISGYPGPYADVLVNLNTAGTLATITFTSDVVGGKIYLMGDGGSVAVNVNGSFTLGTPIAAGSNAGTGFTPGPYSNGGAGNEDGFGSFNLTINSFDGFTHSADTITFTLTGSWANADSVLTGNSSGHLAAAHIFVTSSPAIASNGAIATGYATDGVPVPEPGILILLGIAMSAVGIAYPFVRKI